MSPLEATFVGAKEIGFTVLSISVSLVAVFIPILLMGGIVGRLFREFAMTLSVAIGISMLISLTTTPMMCATLLKSRWDTHHGWLFRTSESFFQSLLRFYEITLSKALRFHVVTMLVMLTTLAFTIYLYVIVPKGFFPQQDTGRLAGNLQADQGTSFQAMSKLLVRFANTVSEDPAVDNVIAFTGGNFGGAANSARMFVSIKPLEQRDASADAIMARIRAKTSKMPGATLVMRFNSF